MRTGRILIALLIQSVTSAIATKFIATSSRVSSVRHHHDNDVSSSEVHSSSRTLMGSSATIHRQHHSLNNNLLRRKYIAAFVHRDCKYSATSSTKAKLDGNDYRLTLQPTSNHYYNPLQPVLIIRGGASSSSNSVQNALQSIIDSSLPSPIKQFIVMICQLLESLTGWEILPVKKAKSSKSGKQQKKRVRDVVVEEEVIVVETITKPRRSKGDKEKSADTTSSEKKQSTSSDTESTKDDATTELVEKAVTSIPKAESKTQRPDAASKKFLSNNIKSSNPNYRIQRELKEFLKSPPPGLSVKISGKNVRLWVITLSMPENTVYAGETYKLRVQFPNDYPTSPPSVYFLPPTPRHEHVYTNGDICLSLLGKDWRPIMTAQSVAQAIFSILCGAQRKSLPMDNSRHAGNKPGQKQDDWVYHDDNC